VKNDIKVIVTVKNNVMLRAMDQAGFETASALAEASGTSPTDVGHYLNLKLAPYNSRGELRPPIERIARALGRLPEDLFPAPFVRRALERNRVEREISSDDLPALMGHNSPSIAYNPERSAVVQEALASLDAALSELRPRDRQALTLIYGLGCGQRHTLEEAARIMGVTRERVRQMALRGERVLRHPCRDLRNRAAALMDSDA
jgi:RNA polymerase sigma factor (sigma-70 family)